MGYDMTEGTVVRWMKSEGESVSTGEIIAEIETDKAIVEFEAPITGTLLKITAKEGESLEVIKKLLQSNIPFIKTKSHIIPIIIGDSVLCKKASDELFDKHKVYLQPINFPTVPRGEERLRITPTPLHTDKMIDELIYALKQTWKKLKLQQAA